jgi:hypothetical protein
MSILLAQTDITVVDHVSALLSLLDRLVHLLADPPSLYLDIEEVKLGRQGPIYIISIYVAPTKKVYLLDINVLGNAAFSIANSNYTFWRLTNSIFVDIYYYGKYLRYPPFQF